VRDIRDAANASHVGFEYGPNRERVRRIDYAGMSPDTVVHVVGSAGLPITCPVKWLWHIEGAPVPASAPGRSSQGGDGLALSAHDHGGDALLLRRLDVDPVRRVQECSAR
jgi:hypothetical protein